MDLDSLARLVELVQRKAPEYLDLLTAETDAEFESAFEVILESAVQHLERNKHNLKALDEVGLTGFLAAALAIPGLSPIPEAHSNGHVDLTIRADHCFPVRQKLVEAKIYDGYAYHISGLSQLLERYSTGRDRQALLVTYVRRPNIDRLTNNLRSRMDKELPLQQRRASVNRRMRWSFATQHTHSSGGELEVHHVACNLHC